MSERIVLGEDDFDEPASAAVAPPAPPRPPAPAAPPPPASAPGALPPVTRRAPTAIATDGPAPPRAPQAGQPWLNDPRLAPLTAAGVGVLAGWAVTQALGVADIAATSSVGIDAATGLWTAIIAVLLGGSLLAFDRAVAGAWAAAWGRVASAALPLAAIGFAAGFAANALYLQILSSVLEGGDFSSFDDARFYLARAAGWAIFGAGVGTAIGFADGSRQRALNGAIGGTIGGALGGLAFQYANLHVSASESSSRLIGLAAVGGLIAVATRAVETARREAWLQIVGGGMRGKEFILYHDVTRLGSSPECEVFLLKDPGVAHEHARISLDGGRRLLTVAPEETVLVNGAPVVRHVLRTGDRLQIGHTLIDYSERAVAAAPSTNSHASTEGSWT
jgi:hypothetical protein